MIKLHQEGYSLDKAAEAKDIDLSFSERFAEVKSLLQVSHTAPLPRLLLMVGNKSFKLCCGDILEMDDLKTMAKARLQLSKL